MTLFAWTRRCTTAAAVGGGVGVATVGGVAHGLHALAAVRWIHFSNNGLAGRDRNPDIEATGAHVGVLMPF
jgi:hypothetical protein